jgi:hypothetical protein
MEVTGDDDLGVLRRGVMVLRRKIGAAPGAKVMTLSGVPPSRRGVLELVIDGEVEALVRLTDLLDRLIVEYEKAAAP